MVSAVYSYVQQVQELRSIPSDVAVRFQCGRREERGFYSSGQPFDGDQRAPILPDSTVLMARRRWKSAYFFSLCNGKTDILTKEKPTSVTCS